MNINEISNKNMFAFSRMDNLYLIHKLSLFLFYNIMTAM